MFEGDKNKNETSRTNEELFEPLTEDEGKELVAYAQKFDSSINSMDRAAQLVMRHLDTFWKESGNDTNEEPKPRTPMEKLAARYNNCLKPGLDTNVEDIEDSNVTAEEKDEEKIEDNEKESANGESEH